MQRIPLIQQRIQDAFAPKQLEVIDDSHKHVGHVGSEGGAGHYTLVISGEVFAGLSRVETHRRIYAVLDDLIPQEIHALKIKVV